MSTPTAREAALATVVAEVRAILDSNVPYREYDIARLRADLRRAVRSPAALDAAPPPSRQGIDRALGRHEYVLSLRTGAVCRCGWIPPHDPERGWTKQQGHREHLGDRLHGEVFGYGI